VHKYYGKIDLASLYTELAQLHVHDFQLTRQWMWNECIDSNIGCLVVFCLFGLWTSVGSTEYDQPFCTVCGRKKQNKATWPTSLMTLNQTLHR